MNPAHSDYSWASYLDYLEGGLDGPNSDDYYRFEFLDPEAVEVFIAGSFNNWNPTANPMSHLGGGRWVEDLLLPPGRYEYRFVVSGFQPQSEADDRAGRYGYRSLVSNQWQNDLRTKEVAPNPNGGFNTVPIVAPGTAP